MGNLLTGIRAAHELQELLSNLESIEKTAPPDSKSAAFLQAEIRQYDSLLIDALIPERSNTAIQLDNTDVLRDSGTHQKHLT